MDRLHYKHQLIFCVPEMDLWAFIDATLCKDRVVAVDVTYKFKVKCLEVEDEINKGQFDVIERLTLKQEINLDNAMHTICIGDVIDHSFHLAERSLYKNKLMFCVLEELFELKERLLYQNCCTHILLLNIYYCYYIGCL